MNELHIYKNTNSYGGITLWETITDDKNGHETRVSYEMVKGRIKIVDNEAGEVVKILKRFKYLKLEEDDEEEYKLALCNKKVGLCLIRSFLKLI